MSLLELEQVEVGWPGQGAVLSGLTLALGQGARVGVVGPNGAGKTSLFHTIAGILAPQQGQVRLRGQPVRQGQFMPAVALVFQQADDQLFCPTLIEDVSFGARNLGLPAPEIAARVAEALHACGLNGLEDRPITQLSGGEKRRACIAGALVMQPDLMLLDEPSAALDLRSRRRLIRLLAGMEHAMLIASHDLELLLDLCPRVIVLDAGRICADGPAHEVLGDAALMDAHGQEVPHSLTPHNPARHQHRPQAKV
ncbi:energy-coupling factor ABC transporter ATP-binding protein [Roseinatronobacter monicus]|uniref:Cobalt/nickel transport system ATP-binding protein n=1 Tax=Roseinatronobacter monicus TaxID=393481 RepID=A0A543KAR2_9RHOB|nr:energy-coupling factor ABC transporter ATP-binding protein [Roseinatronobacter monicus]TQM92170.1 cobalt/nickel transport system ATP-binding protein [Roseinatronobacter monicus]